MSHGILNSAESWCVAQSRIHRTYETLSLFSELFPIFWYTWQRFRCTLSRNLSGSSDKRLALKCCVLCSSFSFQWTDFRLFVSMLQIFGQSYFNDVRELLPLSPFSGCFLSYQRILWNDGAMKTELSASAREVFIFFIVERPAETPSLKHSLILQFASLSNQTISDVWWTSHGQSHLFLHHTANLYKTSFELRLVNKNICRLFRKAHKWSKKVLVSSHPLFHGLYIEFLDLMGF